MTDTPATPAEEALQRIVQWSEAYPLDIFPEPDLVKAHALLKAGGMTLDAISASCMRRVIEGVGKIAREAIGEIAAPVSGDALFHKYADYMPNGDIEAQFYDDVAAACSPTAVPGDAREERGDPPEPCPCCGALPIDQTQDPAAYLNTAPVSGDARERARALLTWEYMSRTPIEQRVQDIAAALTAERAETRRAALGEAMRRLKEIYIDEAPDGMSQMQAANWAMGIARDEIRALADTADHFSGTLVRPRGFG